MTNDKEEGRYETDIIAVDDECEFSDAGLSVDTDLASLCSTIRDHVYENGRRYHSLNQGTYVMPNDQAEQERLDMLHHAMGLVLDGELQVVELPKQLKRVLDCGTGTGIWAIDFADQHPKCQVIGVDLSPIQPTWVPSNCTFEVDDLEKPWLYKEPFDFIHSANVCQGIRDWPGYCRKIYDNLVPGGVVEFIEGQFEPCFMSDDDSIPHDGYLFKFDKEFNAVSREAGLTDKTSKLEKLAKDAGFVNVRVVAKKIPLGMWAKDRKLKDLGRWGLAILEQGLISYSFALFTRNKRMTPEAAKELCESAFKEMYQPGVHSYILEWFVTGVKPLE